MISHPLFRFVIPSVILGGGAGFLIGNTLGNSKSVAGKGLSPRAAFLSSDDDAVDYEKLARVCVHAASVNGGRSSDGRPTSAPISRATEEAKEGLDRVMSVSLESGVWSRGASFRADGLLRELPATDVADFERLLKTALERGDLTLQDGAWLPDGVR